MIWTIIGAIVGIASYNNAKKIEEKKELLRKANKHIWENDIPPRNEKERLEQENRRLEYQMAILNGKKFRNSKKNNLPWNKI